jgi:hypothetical protein
MDTATLTPLVKKPDAQHEHSNGGLITFPGGVIKNNAGEVELE